MEYGHYAHFFDYAVSVRSGITGVTEYSYDVATPPKFADLQKFPISDSLVLSSDASHRASEIIDVVNALSQRHVLRYGSYQAWFISHDDDRKCSYGQEFYTHPDVGVPDSVDSSPGFEHRDEISLILYENDLPKRIIRLGELLNIYFRGANSNERELFRDACRVVRKARRLAAFDISTSFMLLVSAIESLVHIEHISNKVGTCSECGQEKYSVMRKFRDFLDKYCFEIEKKKKDHIYAMRSALVHRGQFLPHDKEHKMYIENEADWERTLGASASRTDYEILSRATTACFKTFLFSNLNIEA